MELFKKIRNNWITTWLVIAALSLTTIIAYAAYTRVNVTKRVMSTGAGVGDRFSSDVMSSAGTVTRKGYSGVENTEGWRPNVDGKVFNYPHPKTSLYRNSKTDYQVTATIGTYVNGTFSPLTGEDLTNLSDDYSIKYKSSGNEQRFNENNGEITLSCSMAAGKIDPDEIYMYFSTDELSVTPPGYYIQLVAQPDETELPTLTGYVTVRYQEVADSGWKGTLEELDDSHFDGYNYILEGNGSGRITFRYNPTYVNINQYFLHNSENKFYFPIDAETGNTVEGSDSITENSFTPVNGMTEITLVVDSEKKNRYVIQFYKKDSSQSFTNNDVKNYLPDTNPADWEEIN